jgi:deoxycytidine triphosphate deaminase
MAPLDEVMASTGFLTDRHISAALDDLMEKGTADVSQVRHASYMLRLGDKVELCKAQGSSRSETKSFEIVRVGTNAPLELNPGDTALLFSAENLRIPANVMGFTVARGLLFAESLTPENTYVDPGFSGNLYTTVTNVSGRIVRLSYKMPIARLFFYKLSEPAEQPYRSGTAMKIEQQLETVPTSDIESELDCSKAAPADLKTAIKKIPLGGTFICELFNRTDSSFSGTNKNILRLFLWSVFWPILLVVANTSLWVRDNLGAFLSNVVASLVAAGLTISLQYLYSRRTP